MEDSQRRRSPSHPSSARHTPVASPSPAFTTLNSFTSAPPDFQSSTFAPDFNLAATSASQPNYNQSYDFTATSALFPDGTSGDPAIDAQGNATFPDFVTFDATAGLPGSTTFNEPLFNPSADSSYIDNSALDPALLDPQISPQSIPPVNPLGQMATQSHAPTPPHLLAPNMHRQSSSPHGSPGLPQGQFQSPPPPHSHSRNQSLDPSSAAYPQGQMGEWGGSSAFQGHRRTYSDAHSEISSAHQSPYLQASDSFEHPLEHSPNLGAHDPTMFQDVMGIGQVSLSEVTPSYISPAHSPHISPALLPQNMSPAFPVENFNLVPSSMAYDPSGMQNIQMRTSAPESFPNVPGSAETPGLADTMSPPQITFEPAPPSRQTSFEPPNKDIADATALTPPEKPRGRAKSDPFSSRGSTPANALLSPRAAGVGSRSPSPSNKSRRSSTSSVPNRDYILDLADPSRPASTNSTDTGNIRKTQKHPATFQCSLCPKRFTRAYNLRSHLRTHTDERPFVCSHCGKAFARQHDRKRHEGLHSGEKKFVCRGQLKDGNNWGCGRRFARADALGRHFRSEAGRVCIKPLMDEEALERSQPPVEPGAELGIPIMPMPNQQMMVPQPGYTYNMSNQGFQPGMPMAAPQMSMRLPTALLQQYPTLGNIWDTLPTDEVEGDISGRSSFDASSAGEYDEDEQWNGNHGAAFGWASDVGP